MKATLILLSVFAFALSLGTPAFAAKGSAKIPGTGKGGNNNKDKGDEAAAKFDKNHNGRIDGDEVAAIQAAFEKEKNGPLKKYDLNHNGNLEKSEVASIHFAPRAKK